MSTEYSLKETELFPGTLRGYRSWRVYKEGLRPPVLQAYNWDHVFWEPGVNQATCVVTRDVIGPGKTVHPRPQDAPVQACTCGFYATYDFSFPVAGMNSIRGSIKASGRIILGTNGFRAEKVEVEALYRYTTDGFGQTLATMYNVPLFRTQAALEEAFPPPNVEALIGPRPPVHVRWAQALMPGRWAPDDEDALRLYEWSAPANHQITFHNDQGWQNYVGPECAWGYTGSRNGEAGWVKLIPSGQEGGPATVTWGEAPPWVEKAFRGRIWTL